MPGKEGSRRASVSLKSLFHRTKGDRIAATEPRSSLVGLPGQSVSNQSSPASNTPDGETQADGETQGSSQAGISGQEAKLQVWRTNADIWEAAQRRIKSDRHWASFNQRFRDDNELSVDGILAGFSAARELCEAQKWTVEISIGDIKFKPRNVLTRIIQYAESFKEIGGAVAGLDLTKHAGLAWGALQFLITLAVKNESVHDLIDNHEVIANIMCRTSIYAEMYLTRSEIQSSSRISETVCRVYVSVLRYLVAAWHFLEHSKVYHALSSLAPTSPVQEAFSNILKHEQELATWQAAAGAEIVAGSREQIVTLTRKLADLDIPMNRVVRKVENMYDKDQKASTNALLEWISPIQHYDRFEEVRYSLLDGTGQWLLQDELFRSWREQKDELFRSSGIEKDKLLRFCRNRKVNIWRPSGVKSRHDLGMLWLSGKMGSGKSTLMSLVVDELLEESQIDRQKLVAFFFCDKTSRNGQLLGPRSILRSLLKQLVSMKGEIPEYLNQAYKSERRNGIINRKAHFFMQSIIRSAKETRIVIDGLDECDIETRTELLDDLKWLENDDFGDVRIIVASRPDSDIDHFFQENHRSATIKIRSDHDIELFVRKKVEEEFRLKRFSPTLRSSEEQIITILISRSEGMFRWVQMSLKSLRAKGRPETAIKRLKELPRELKELYDDIYEEIGRIDPSDSLLVRRTLWLIMYQRVPLRSTEIVEAVWDDSLEDSSDNMGQRIQLLSDMCSDFVELDTNTGYFRLAHSSVRDFLQSREEFAENAGHAELAKMCVSAAAEWFRKADTLQNYALSWKLGHFICYALTQWPAHVWKASNLRAEDKELVALLDVRRNRCPPSVAWRTWLSRVLSLAPSLTDDEATHFSATDKDSMVSGGSGVYGSPENMSSGSGSSASGTDTAPTSTTTRPWQERRRRLPHRGDCIQKAARQLLKRSTSIPPNPLFAFSAWHIPELVCGTALLADSLNLWQMRNIVGETPVTDFCTSFSIPVLERALTGDLEIIFKALLKRHPEFISAAITRDFAPDEKTRLVELLLEHGAEFHRGSTSQPNALHSAADFNLPNVLKLLLAHGAEIDARDYSHATALDRACANGSVGAARLLLSRDASTNSDFHRIPPLTVAATHHQWDIFRLLLNDQVDLNTTTDGGRSLLELALHDSNDEMVVLLLQRGAKISTEGSDQRSLLLAAVISMFPSVAIIRALLEHGADVNEVGDSQPSPLQYAAEKLGANVIGLFCSHGGDLNGRDIDGKTALQIAVSACNVSGTSALIEAKADVEARDDKGRTALHLAVQDDFANEDIIFLLCKHGADPSTKDDTGKTALHLATAAGSVCGVRALIKLQVDFEAKDADGRTALHLATQLWSNYGPQKKMLEEVLSLIDLLLSNDANINATDNNGDTPLFLASGKASRGGDRIAEYLLAKGADSSIINSKGETAAMYHRTQPKSILKKRTHNDSRAP